MLKSISTREKYDQFLIVHKQNRIKRIGEFKNTSTNIDHECNDIVCGRKWKPKPSQMLDDDYYCPSCVLHHRNNIERFDEERLKWTRYIPNTFYLFEITDPNNTNIKLVKFGRTQNKDAKKRYPNSELKEYKMNLLLELRGNLITITRIENYWKKKASSLNLFYDFSIGTFHGKSECIIVDANYDKFIEVTHKIYNENSDEPNNDGFQFDE